MPSLTGGDAVVKFKFLRTQDQGIFRNKMSVNLLNWAVEAPEVNKFAIDISDTAIGEQQH